MMPNYALYAHNIVFIHVKWTSKFLGTEYSTQKKKSVVQTDEKVTVKIFWSTPLSYVYLEKSRMKKKLIQVFTPYSLCCGSMFPDILKAHHSFKLWATNQPITQNHITPETRILMNSDTRTILQTRHDVNTICDNANEVHKMVLTCTSIVRDVVAYEAQTTKGKLRAAI